jgi:hypothetical protein
MRNISTAIKGHYDDDRYMWAIIIRRLCGINPPIDGRSGDAPLKTNQLPRVGAGAAEQWAQQGPPSKDRRAPRILIYGRRRLALEGWLERIETCYRNPQKGVVIWMINWPRARAQTLSITRPIAGFDQKGGCARA